MAYDPEMKEIIDAFVSEGYERLEQAESQLPHIQEAYHEQIVQTLFRLFHSLKGSAGYLNFENIKNLTHEAESLLDIFRKTGLKPSPEDVDLIYKAMDFLRQLLDNVAANLTDEGFEGQVSIMIDELAQATTRHLTQAEHTPSPSVSPPAPTPAATAESLSQTESAPEGWVEEIPIVEEITVEEESSLPPAEDHTPGAVLSPEGSSPSEEASQPLATVSPEEAAQEKIPSEESVASESPGATVIEEEIISLQEESSATTAVETPEESLPSSSPQASPPDFSQFRLDNIITPEMLDRFRDETADLLDEAERHIVSLEQSTNRTEDIQSIFRAIHTIKGNASFLMVERIARQAETLENILDSLRQNTMPFTPAVTNLLLRGIDYIRHDLTSLEREENEPQTTDTYKPLGEILVEMGAADKETIEEALLQKEKPLGEILVEKGVVDENTVTQALKKQATMTENLAGSLQKREIRVDASRLDRLFDLMGELINAEAMVLHHPLIKEIQDDTLQKAISHLAKISRELQEVTMEVRMVPLEGLFVRMHRLVRDLARKFNKSIELRIIGQENEIDKNLIDQIADPLVHLLRNAIDHGIESPEERRQKGKPEQGVIELAAQYQGNEIWISVRDDGRGLDREKILAKARKKHLLTRDPSTMTENEIWRLIFLPGFSTKDEVTEVSGRGVGMDVVSKNIEKLRGQVDIKTSPDQGTTITMKIPLTMAILDGVVCRIGQFLFIVPLADIVEFVKPQASQITRGEGQSQLLNLRGEILPILDIEEIFYHQPNPTPLPSRILIVVTNQDRKMTIAVDEILSSQQVVVKSLSDFIGRIEGIIGCSILNEGQIGFIMDIHGLVKRVLE